MKFVLTVSDQFALNGFASLVIGIVSTCQFIGWTTAVTAATSNRCKCTGLLAATVSCSGRINGGSSCRRNSSGRI